MLLQVSGLAAGYGRKQVIRDVNLTVGEREVVAVLGHNGAGKSTLMNAIFGAIRPTSGCVMFRGADITGSKPSANISRGLGYTPQGAEVFKTLSVAENLMIGGYALKDQRQLGSRIERVQEVFPVLHARRNYKAGSLSGGERQMLALGMLLVAAPRLVILDEPSGGLAPIMVKAMYAAIAEVASKLEASVLLVEQDANDVLKIANRVYVIANGSMKFEAAACDIDGPEQLGSLLLGY